MIFDPIAHPFKKSIALGTLKAEAYIEVMPPKPSIAAKVSFWSQFVGSIASLFFKGAEDKQKVINIAQGISQTADVVVQAQDSGEI